MVKNTNRNNKTLLDSNLKALVEKGKQRGFLTYEEMNDELPDENLSPDRLDNLLMTLDDLGIDLIDEADIDSREGRGDENSAADVDEQDGQIEQALVTESSRRIDDPVRMYLTQMGEIPLLTRDEEIALAKKIELTRMAFRRKVLENDLSMDNAVTILEQVEAGNLPFDRTMRISTANHMAKISVTRRIPENLRTVHRIMKLNQQGWQKFHQETDPEVCRQVKQTMTRRRRHAARISSTTGSATTDVLDSSANRNSASDVTYHRRRRSSSYRRNVTIDSAKKSIDSTFLRSAIQATDSTATGWTANTAAANHAPATPKRRSNRQMTTTDRACNRMLAT